MIHGYPAVRLCSRQHHCNRFIHKLEANVQMKRIVDILKMRDELQQITISPEALLLVFLSLLGWDGTAYATARERDRPRYSLEDPTTHYMCRGSLADYAACTCVEDEELSCINAQFVDTEIFININNHYKALERITLHGNNFQDLPSTSLFGSTVHNRLLTLNISANYIVNLHSNALKGMPNLRILDLSNNEIVLKDSDSTFLTHTPHLTEIYLRRAFTSTINRTVQFSYIMDMFRNAHLLNLQVLDLSYNFLTSVPYDLPCPFPSLKHFDLRQNFLQSFDVNATCLAKATTINLNRNQLNRLTPEFMELADKCLEDSILLRNPFYCDCNSVDFIKWIRSTKVIRQKSTLVCERASPDRFYGARLTEVPLHRIDCSVNFYSSTSKSLISRIFEYALLLLITNIL